MPIGGRFRLQTPAVTDVSDTVPRAGEKTGQIDGGLKMVKIGEIAPDFTLPSHNGPKVTLSQFRGSKNVVLAFYPLDWTPV